MFLKTYGKIILKISFSEGDFMKKFSKALAIFLSVLLLLGSVPLATVSVGAAETAQENVGASSGTTGDCTWTLDDEGTLTISGSGAMEDYSYNSGNNETWGQSIKSVIINLGVTNIGRYGVYN